MAARTLILTETSASGDKIQNSISNINPAVNGNTLKSFTQKLNAMSTNTYVKTDCVDKRNVDTEEVQGTDVRPTPTITFSNVPTLAQAKGGAYMGITYTGDGQLYAYTKSGMDMILYAIIGNGSQMMLGSAPSTSSGHKGGTIVVGALGTDNFKPVEAEFTVE